MADKEYSRLTRTSSGGFAIIKSSRTSLWLGTDHLLCVDSTGYTENYKRFYFRDIQAIIIRQTEAWKIWGLAFASICALFGLFTLLSSDMTARIVLGCVAAIFFIGLLFAVVPGPSATCHLRTAVQTELLGSANRLRRARRVLERLRPLIAQAQGELSQQELATMNTETPLPAQSPATNADAVEDPNVPPLLKP